VETRRLGNSDLYITRLGIGAWAMGGGGWNGSMGPQNDDDSISGIHAALDYGLNWNMGDPGFGKVSTALPRGSCSWA
jgi:aryl-alcohol dehydrogenase-like predicted oxidoreductase